MRVTLRGYSRQAMSPQPGKRERWRDPEPTLDERRLERLRRGSFGDRWNRGDWWDKSWLIIGPRFVGAFVVGLIVTLIDRM